ncbi:MAG TPA: GGDEF domain-containing protein [Geomonas sp.]
MKWLRELLKLDIKKKPDALLRLFITTAVVSILVILFLAGTGFRGVLQRYIIVDAEQEAISVSSALLAEEAYEIIATRDDGTSYLEITNKDIPRLDQHLRRFLAPFGIVKIKIYRPDARVVYSTDTKVIGEADPLNSRLKRALAGQFDSHFERKESVHDLADELRFNVDVVETYIPIRGKDKKVIGSFEIYLDVTQYREQIHLAVALSVGILALTLILVYGSSFLLIRRGTRDLKEMQEMLRTQAITDPLTGFFNKRQILLLTQKEFSRVARKRKRGLADSQLGCIMMDIDNFKQMNDSYGHLAGDAFLRELAARITPSLRVYDTVGRFGGDEFVIILPGSDLDQSSKVARKIWSLVRDEPFQLEGQAVRVTLSLGVSVAEEGDVDSTYMLKRADDALYMAKHNGRDRYESVCTATSE